MNNQNELYHYGVLGMKWGRRKAMYNNIKTAKANRKARDQRIQKEYDRSERNIEKNYKKGQSISNKDYRKEISASNRAEKAWAKSKEQYVREKAAAKSKYKQDVAKIKKEDKKLSEDWKQERKKYIATKSNGNKVAKFLLNGAFGSYTYNSLRTTGHSRLVSEGLTVASTLVGGPLGAMAMSKYTSTKYKDTKRKKN